MAKMQKTQPSVVIAALGWPLSLFKTDNARNMVTSWVVRSTGPLSVEQYGIGKTGHGIGMVCGLLPAL
tara:strand:- start:503 stop:706 length:204 start_codon:yes stop_codon:yes gene_type:complete